MSFSFLSTPVTHAGMKMCVGKFDQTLFSSESRNTDGHRIDFFSIPAILDSKPYDSTYHLIKLMNVIVAIPS